MVSWTCEVRFPRKYSCTICKKTSTQKLVLNHALWYPNLKHVCFWNMIRQLITYCLFQLILILARTLCYDECMFLSRIPFLSIRILSMIFQECFFLLSYAYVFAHHRTNTQNSNLAVEYLQLVFPFKFLTIRI